MEKSIVYDCRWSDKLDESFIRDFVCVEKTVFGEGWNRELFDRKFLENIYGPSVLVVVYIGDKPVASRSFWRNDLFDKIAYQPGDTCVLPESRGLGVFTEMTKVAMKFLKGNEVIYNYPNKNSFHGYIKMGWSLQGEYFQRILLFNRQYKKEDPYLLDSNYASWWLSKAGGIYSIKKGCCFYLVRKNLKRPFLYILARVDNKTASQFPKMSSLRILFYMSKKKCWYNAHLNTIYVVSRDTSVFIPLWKIDAI